LTGIPNNDRYYGESSFRNKRPFSGTAGNPDRDGEVFLISNCNPTLGLNLEFAADPVGQHRIKEAGGNTNPWQWAFGTGIQMASMLPTL